MGTLPALALEAAAKGAATHETPPIATTIKASKTMPRQLKLFMTALLVCPDSRHSVLLVLSKLPRGIGRQESRLRGAEQLRCDGSAIAFERKYMVTYQLDPAHSSAQFKVRHMMISYVKGEFHKISGTVNFDPDNPTISTIEVTIDAASINTRNEQRDADLKSTQFLDVEKFPVITFKSKKVSLSGAGKFTVTGDLTIRGGSKPVILDVEDVTEEAKDPWGNLRRGATAKTRINRKDFGMTVNVALETGGFLVGEDVDITIDVEMIRQP
jgi:polyisoprenoid-binding protein YceI